MRGWLASAAMAAMLCGCVSRASDVSASYVTPIDYQSHPCPRLAEEAQAIAARATQVAGPELSNLDGHMKEIERASVQKGCDIDFLKRAR